ncbi:MAG: trigger factor [Betaproteobacteria bacterium]
MQATIEKVGGLERRLNVTLPAQEIDDEVENRLKRLARTVRMHGFRPGKVPYRLIQQQYGGQVRQEVLGDALQKTFGEAVRSQNLRVAGYPRFEPKTAEPPNDDVQFSATFEVYPDVELGDLANATVERPSVEPGDAEVDKTIAILRKQRVTYEPADRPAQRGDRVTIDYRGTRDGEPFDGGTGNDHPTILGEGQLLPEFEAQVAGLRAGESRTFEVTFPEDYHGKDLAGKAAQFEVTVKQVESSILPEADAEFAKQLGIVDGDIDKMRSDIKTNLQRELRRRIQARIKDQVMKALLENTKLELPKSLVDLETDRLMAGMRQDLTARGLKADEIPMPREAFEPEARKRVGLGLIVADIVRQHQLQAKPEQIKAIVNDYAESYERPEEVVRWYYQSPERLREVESLVLEDNVVQWVLSQVKTVDKAADFDELMGNAK